MLRTGTVLADRYQLDDPIAAGGVGQVWRATDLVLQRPIAIKLLRPEYADHHETLSRFRAEARHAGSLAHPGIAQVYDFGDNPAEGPPYLVMELVDGPSLADVLATEPVTPAYALEVLAKAATGLAAAHEAGLVHRDIKPGNILLGRDGQVKITDFGIAHAVGSAPVTDPGLVMGTTQYLAPERIAGGSGTPAADLYSLGIVMHECLSGVPPYEGTPAEVMAGHLYVPLPPLPAGTPPEVADLVARLTAKDPEQRITDANELAALAQTVHSAITGSPMPRQRQAPAVSPASGVAAPAFADPARMPRTGDHHVPHTGDMMLDPSLAAQSTGEHPYADPPVSPAAVAAGLPPEPEAVAGPDDDTDVVGGFRVDAPGTELALREPGDGHGTVAIPAPGAPDPLRETSVDLGSAEVAAAGAPGLDETSVDLMGVSHIQSGAPDSPGARTTSVDMASLEAVGADGSASPHGTLLDSSTDPFATEGTFSDGPALPGLEGMPEAGGRPRGRRRAAIGIGVVLLAGGGLAGVAASGMLHASPAADRTDSRTSHQPLSAVQPDAGSQSTPAKTAGAKPGKHGKPYTARHAKTAAPASPSAPAASSAPVQQRSTSGSVSPSGGGTASGGSSSPSAPKSQSPQPSPPQSSKACLLGILCSG